MSHQPNNAIASAIPSNTWYLSLLVSLVFISIGIYVLTYPGLSYVVLAILFSLSFLFSGISEIASSIVSRKANKYWVWSLIFGLVTFSLGVLLVIHPLLADETLPYFIGFLVLFRGINAIGFSFDLKENSKDWIVMLILGFLGVFIGFILLSNPVLAGFAYVVWIGIALIIAGISGVYYSFKIKQ